MWSVVIFDKIKNKLIFSRDIFWRKPLYVYTHKKELLFGSEIKFLEKLSIKNLSRI